MKHLEGRINTQILGVKGLSGTNPAMEDAEVNRKVCFKHKSIGYCYRSVQIKVKNCGSYHIYKLFQPPTCDLRHCGTNWCWGNKLTMSIVQCEMVKSQGCFASARLTHLASITETFLRKTVASATLTKSFWTSHEMCLRGPV